MDINEHACHGRCAHIGPHARARSHQYVNINVKSDSLHNDYTCSFFDIHTYSTAGIYARSYSHIQANIGTANIDTGSADTNTNATDTDAHTADPDTDPSTADTNASTADVNVNRHPDEHSDANTTDADRNAGTVCWFIWLQGLQLGASL
ncbi:MAG: hypothetical protein JXC32_21620 [Anaerolineae bacterium]|nr:hypothetical protein [Anaerolineae bacterium]